MDRTKEDQNESQLWMGKMLSLGKGGWNLGGSWRYKTRLLGVIDTGNKDLEVTNAEIKMETLKMDEFIKGESLVRKQKSFGRDGNIPPQSISPS